MAEGDGEAVCGIVRPRDLVQPEEPAHHLLDLAFPGAARPGDRLFDLVRCVLGDGDPALPGGEEDDPPDLADGKRGGYVPGEEDLFDGDAVGAVFVQDGGDGIIDRDLKPILPACPGPRLNKVL